MEEPDSIKKTTFANYIKKAKIYYEWIVFEKALWQEMGGKNYEGAFKKDSKTSSLF